MTERFLVIFFALTTIGWSVYHFFAMRKIQRALETTIRMSNPKRDRPSAMTGHHHVSHPHGSGGGGGGGSGSVSLKYPHAVGVIAPTPKSSGGKKVKM